MRGGRKNTPKLRDRDLPEEDIRVLN